jgi:hypothetical protein
MSGAFVRKYSDEQRDAMIAARLDRRIPYRRIIELARSGELVPGLEPFDPPISTIASLARDARKRRMGGKVSQLAQLPPRDAIEALRRRLLNSADAMLQAEEKRKPEQRSADRQRDIARMAREAAALKPPADAAAPAPGAKTNGTQAEGPTRSGMAAEILKANRAQEETAQSAPSVPHTYTDGQAAATHAADHGSKERTDAADRRASSLTRRAATADRAELEHVA